MPPNSIIRKVGWQDNPWFGGELEAERQHMLRVDPDAYDHVWEGGFRQLSQASIFRGRFRVAQFETPEHVDRFFYGADFGFAEDPATLVRCYILGNTLFVDWEAYEIGVLRLIIFPTFTDACLAQRIGRSRLITAVQRPYRMCGAAASR